MTRKRSTHDRALEKIISTPEKFGFPKIIFAAKEPQLYNKIGRLLAEPDILFIQKDGTHIIVEYKANGNERLTERAHSQLERAAVWLGRYQDHIPEDKIKTVLISAADPKYKHLF